MSFTVIGAGVSPFVRKVLVTLMEKDLAFEVENVNPFAPPPDFRQVSPLGKIPALRHDDRIINDSSVICAYIEQLHPEPALYPEDPYARARALWIEEYIDNGVVPVAGPKVFFPLVIEPLQTGKDPDETGPLAAFEELVPPHFSYLEEQLGDREFFVGDRLTIADITVGSVLGNLRFAGLHPDGDRFPRLLDFERRIHARKSFENAFAPLLPTPLGKRWIELPS